MALTKVTSGLISADASSVDLNIDAGTLYIDATNNRVGIGTTSPDTLLHLNSTTGAVLKLARQDGSVVSGDSLGKVEFYTNDATNTGVAGYIDVIAESGAAGGAMLFGTGTAGSASEQVRIAANGNVGIGTDSPSDVLHVKKTSGGLNARIESADSNAAGHLYQNITTGTTTGDGLFVGIGSGEQGYMYHYESQPLIFGTDGTEKVRIDSSGNVGIGTSSPADKLHVAGDFLLENGDPELYLGTTSATHYNWKIAAQDSVNAGFEISSGTQSAGTGAPSDTYTQRVVIKADTGNVGIGTSSPQQLLSTTKSNISQVHFGAVNTSGGYLTSTSSNQSILSGGGYWNGTNWIATAGESSAMHLVSGIVSFYTNSGLTASSSFSPQERMRLDSSGNLLIGKTSSGVTNNGFEINQNSASGVTSSNNNSGNNTYHVYNTGDGTYKFYVSFGGTINAVNTSISGLSDERLKENIVDLETGLTEVMALKPRRFDWKDGSSKNIAGFIAQEVETVLPDLIDGYKHDTIKDAKSLKMGDMLPTLVKAIQELSNKVDNQQVLIEQLQAEVALLKGE